MTSSTIIVESQSTKVTNVKYLRRTNIKKMVKKRKKMAILLLRCLIRIFAFMIFVLFHLVALISCQDSQMRSRLRCFISGHFPDVFSSYTSIQFDYVKMGNDVDVEMFCMKRIRPQPIRVRAGSIRMCFYNFILVFSMFHIYPKFIPHPFFCILKNLATLSFRFLLCHSHLLRFVDSL